MATESVGTARLDIIVDTTQFDTAIDRAKSKQESFSKDGQRQYAALTTAQRRNVDSLIKQADSIGLNREAQIAYNAATRVGGPLVDDLTRRMRANAAAAEAAAKSMDKGSISLKQQQAALRGVPAQITDIITSLQGGQAPLTVLLQQGGQLKDMFGGVRPAVAALSAQLAAMINPVTVTAAVTVALAAAWHSGAQESVAFNRAIILTGNNAGVTAGELGTLAERLSGIDTRGRASAVLAEIASSGKFTATQLEAVGRAALAMSELTGQSTAETIQQFESLRGSPTKALVELNDKYHFLTAAVYEQVSALEEQGRTQEATTLAMDVASRALAQRREEIVQNLGFIEQAWLRVKAGALAAINAMMNLGRSGSIDDRLADVSQRLVQASDRSNPVTATLTPAEQRSRIADLQKEQQSLIRQQMESWRKTSAEALPAQAATLQASLDQEAKQYSDNAKKRTTKIAEIESKANDAIAKARQAGGADLAKNIAKIEADKRTIIAGIERQYKDPATPKGRKAATPTDPTESIVNRLRQQINLNEEEAKSLDKVTASDRLRVQVLSELERLGAQVTTQRRAQIELLLQEENSSYKLAEANRLEAKAKEDLVRLQQTLKSGEDAKRQENAVALAQFGIGDSERQRLLGRLEIEEWFNRQMEVLSRDRSELTVEQYQKEEDALRLSLAVRLTEEENYQNRLAAMRGDWTNGAKAALADFNDRVGDVAGNTRDLFNRAFEGLSDVVTDFVTGGKADFKDFADSVARDLARLFVQQGINRLAQQFMPGLLGSQGSGAGGFLGSLFSGGATTGGESLGSIFDLFTSGFAKGGAFQGGVQAFANGGVFDWNAKSRAQAFASGGIVSRPSYFGMSGGRLGLMGEAGPEAIMPLRRMAGGRLGIQAEVPSASAQGGNTSVNVVQNVVVQGRITRQTTGQLEAATGRAARRSMARNS